jgi:hypothetical protein
VERIIQRHKLKERVQLAGGWDVIQRECTQFAQVNSNGIYFPWRDTNLPPAILALKPIRVESDPDHRRVRIRVFGVNSTGGHSTPYLGLDVFPENSGEAEAAMVSAVRAAGNSHSTVKRVAEGIYQTY